jgi:hypothetical protein
MDGTITLKTKAADRLTDIRAAHNELAVAIMHFNKSHSRDDKQKIANARKRIHDLELGYHQGTMALYAAVCDRQK